MSSWLIADWLILGSSTPWRDRLRRAHLLPPARLEQGHKGSVAAVCGAPVRPSAPRWMPHPHAGIVPLCERCRAWLRGELVIPFADTSPAP
jgi:hypothetical protein